VGRIRKENGEMVVVADERFQFGGIEYLFSRLEYSNFEIATRRF
jgi:hypothetical protein